MNPFRPLQWCATLTPVNASPWYAPHGCQVDPFEEFNYLGLECAMAGTSWIRAVLLVSLSQAGIAPPSPALLAAYGVNRCLTRARLAIDHLRDPEVRTPEKWPAQVRSYLQAAAPVAKGDDHS
jgi:hypothetical protein